MHYGLLFEVAGYKFDKHWQYELDVSQCPPWNLSEAKHRTGGLFAHPPRPKSLSNQVGSPPACPSAPPLDPECWAHPRGSPRGCWQGAASPKPARQARILNGPEWGLARRRSHPL